MNTHDTHDIQVKPGLVPVTFHQEVSKILFVTLVPLITYPGVALKILSLLLDGNKSSQSLFGRFSQTFLPETESRYLCIQSFEYLQHAWSLKNSRYRKTSFNICCWMHMGILFKPCQKQPPNSHWQPGAFRVGSFSGGAAEVGVGSSAVSVFPEISPFLGGSSGAATCSGATGGVSTLVWGSSKGGSTSSARAGVAIGLSPSSFPA